MQGPLKTVVSVGQKSLRSQWQLTYSLLMHNLIFTGLPTPPSVIHSQLLSILSDSRPPATHSPCYLTTLPRDKWAEMRDQLENIDQNKEALEKIDSSIFTLSLDDHHPKTLEDIAYTMLHNKGANRWDLHICMILASQHNYILLFSKHWML